MIVDKKALKILFDYNLLNPSDTSKADWEYAKEQGLMFDMTHQNHDDTVESLFKEMAICSKKHITNLFLSSLSSYRLNLRIGLPTYAIMSTFPKHKFEPTGEGSLMFQCKHCESPPNDNFNLSFANQISYKIGGIIGYNAYYLNFYLKQQNLLANNIIPNEADFKIFINLIKLIKESEENETPKTLLKKIKSIPFLKSKEEDRKALIETLGYCSILETKEHKGFLNKFTLLGLAPRKTHNSDWHYPVDWWKGKDGINKEALQFWFGEYIELNECFV